MIPSDLDIKKKYSIIGSPKCGTSSLGEYMRRLGYDVLEEELHFMDFVKARTLDRIPIIILRDPVERAWSDFCHFKDLNPTLEQACRWSRYEEGIKLWKNPIIFHLEELVKIPEFPHHNENIFKPKLDDENREKIMRLLS